MERCVNFACRIAVGIPVVQGALTRIGFAVWSPCARARVRSTALDTADAHALATTRHDIHVGLSGSTLSKNAQSLRICTTTPNPFIDHTTIRVGAKSATLPHFYHIHCIH